MSGIRFEGVTKTYGDVVALHELDLEIQAGEFVSLLGPSGSGKTTALNVLSGLVPHDEGEIYIGGRPVGSLSPSERDVAMVFQNYALYPHMTIFENIAFPLRARGRRLAEAEIERKVLGTAEMLGVAPLLGRLPKELSGGQQQRVALGRAMVRDPSVFLLDEPLSNLDARLRIRMRQDIKALHDRLGGTAVYVTHDQAEALAMSDRIAIFNHGRLQQLDAPNLIYACPVNMFVANFVGEREISFVRGTLRTDSRGVGFFAPDFETPLAVEAPACASGAGWDGRPAVLGVRAEAATAAAADAPGIGGTVRLTEWAGLDLMVCVRSGDQDVWAKAAPGFVPERGAPVRLLVDPSRVLLFDPTTERALTS